MSHTTTKKHIIVGMSGGVDSSIAAYLLKAEGHHVEGVFMKNWEEDDTETYCAAEQDIKDAEKICDKLNIHLNVVNFSDHYWERVFTLFLEEYQKGRTPNPDILCNKEIKFAAFLDYALQKGADYIATGHYARTHQQQLLKGIDANKDQSYFLHALSDQQLAKAIFPIGALNKKTVRELAKTLGFINYNKKDSTGICFIGKRKFRNFLENYLPAKPGLILTAEKEIIGQHAGLMFYTIGQRQGLEIGGQKGKQEAPWYVAKKNLLDNTLTVVQGVNHPLLFQKTLEIKSIHWISEPPKNDSGIKAKIRYRQEDQDCEIKTHDHTYQIIFKHAQRAVTPGQSIVFYQNDICLGGGIIEA